MEENKGKFVFYVLREIINQNEDAFGGFNSDLQTVGKMCNFEDRELKMVIENDSEEIREKFKEFSLRIKVTLEGWDFYNLERLRLLVSRIKTKYRVYSQLFNCFLPARDEMISLEFGIRNEQVLKFFNHFKLRPIYLSRFFETYYALNEKKEVVLVNDYLLRFFINKEILEEQIPELCYKVADDIQTFTLKDDRGLIPRRFYEYYNRSIKIINDSNFNIDNPGRKVFIKPFIYELRDKNSNFYTIADDERQGLLQMDKIRTGETLDDSIKRILKDELKIADDYLGALVMTDIEFDRDRDGILTPRLLVAIYIDKIKGDRIKIERLSQNGWVHKN